MSQAHEVKTMNENDKKKKKKKGRLVISLLLNRNVGEEDILLAES